MNLTQRKNRIIARGEFSNHSHVVTGDAEVRRENGKILVEVGNEGAVLKHILETAWLDGQEVWTGEHTDIALEPGQTYEFIQQSEYDPYEDKIREVRD